MPRRIWLTGIFILCVSFSVAQTVQPYQNLPVVKSGDMPLYPLLPRRAQVEGDVHLRVTTDGAGVASVVVESGPSMLSKAAQDSVSSWKFEPHEPTSFSTLFRYHLLTEFKCDPDKPSNGEVHLKLPTEVDITATSTLRDSYCDPDQGLDVSEPLRVFLTACEIDGSSVPCETLVIRLNSGSLTITPSRFKDSKREGFIVPTEFRSLKSFDVSVDTGHGKILFADRNIAFLKGDWRIGIDHAPFKEATPVYGTAATLNCVGFIVFEWGEPEVAAWAPCR